MIIKFKKFSDIQKFVSIAEKFDEEVDVIDGRFVCDGKSINGVLSLGIGKNLQTTILTNDESVLKEYESQIEIFKVNE